MPRTMLRRPGQIACHKRCASVAASATALFAWLGDRLYCGRPCTPAAGFRKSTTCCDQDDCRLWQAREFFAFIHRVAKIGSVPLIDAAAVRIRQPATGAKHGRAAARNCLTKMRPQQGRQRSVPPINSDCKDAYRDTRVSQGKLVVRSEI
jgi:hypothetical protein